MLSLSDEAKEAAPNSQVSIATTASLDNEGKQIATESTSQSEKVTISTAGSSVSDCGTVEKSQNKTARILLMPSKAHCESTEPRIAETKDAEKDGGKMYSGDKDPSEVEIRINAANLSKRERRRLRKLAHKGEGRFRNGEPRNDGHNSTHNRGDDVRSSRRRKQSLNKLGKPSKGLIAQAQLQESEYEFKQGEM